MRGRIVFKSNVKEGDAKKGMGNTQNDNIAAASSQKHRHTKR